MTYFIQMMEDKGIARKCICAVCYIRRFNSQALKKPYSKPSTLVGISFITTLQMRIHYKYMTTSAARGKR